jgi:hypothetical protein
MDAIHEVREGKADWDDPIRQKTLYRRAKLMRAHQAADLEFQDVWALKSSDGSPVWQMRT